MAKYGYVRVSTKEQKTDRQMEAMLEYDVKAWAKKNGFNVISCNGDGRDDGYEPKFRRGW
ncbi:MAG: recombinase family protein [Butyrivibrio sp.]|nr:recombinase family protein [Butyrivibrio sp.]MBR1643362.1 recombinase family protein [Butyrivibrio sp.]